MKKAILILLFITFCQNALAYDGTPEDQVDLFFKDIASGNTNVAIDNLYSSNPLMSQKIQQLTMLKQQVGMINSLFGKTIEFETYTVEKFTDSIKRIVKIQKCENHPIVWEFYFYKPKDKWMISKGTFNDQFSNISKKQK